MVEKEMHSTDNRPEKQATSSPCWWSSHTRITRHEACSTSKTMVLLELRGQLRNTDGQPEELQAQRKIAVTVREKGDERNGAQIKSVQKPG